jgi:hypothetical protein
MLLFAAEREPSKPVTSDEQEAVTDRRGGISVLAEMRRVLDTPPDLAPAILRGDTRLTRRWRHGALYDALPAMWAAPGFG